MNNYTRLCVLLVAAIASLSYYPADSRADLTKNEPSKFCTFEVTGLAGGNGSISPSGSTSVTQGGSVSFSATPNPGYQVDEWSVDGEVAQTGGTSYTLSNVQGPHSVDVTFELCMYVVTSSAGSNGSIDPSGSTSVTHGGSVSFSATPDTGYQVNAWSVDSEVVQTGGTSYTLSNVQGPHSVDVTFKLCMYIITSSAGSNGSIDPSGSTSVTHGGSVSFSATPDTDYEVNTWSVDGETVQTGGTSFTLSNVQGPHSVDVTFKLRTYIITGSAGSNGSIDPSGSTSVTHGGSVSFSATPDPDYEVDAWSVDGEVVQWGGTSYTLSNIQADHSVDVTFTPIWYTVTASAGSNGSVSPSSRTVTSGSSLTFTATPSHSYEVDTWFLDGFSAQQGGSTYTLSQIRDDHALYVTFREASSYSLGEKDFEDEEEFEDDLITNNEIDEDQPDESRIHVQRVIGVGQDPDNAAMSMTNLVDLDPTSPTYGKIINARAKGVFVKTSADEILIRFQYLFATAGSGVQLAVYLSDCPELLAPDDPEWPKHYLEVARLTAPPGPRPGAMGSNRFGTFEKVVWTKHLKFDKALYIELELVEPQTAQNLLANAATPRVAGSGDTSLFVDSWGGAVQCYGICLDINWDNFVDEADFLMVVGGCGRSTVGETACMDGALSRDGYMDSYDVASWDWALNSDQRLLNYCGVPLTGTGTGLAGSGTKKVKTFGPSVAVRSLSVDQGDLLIAGKSGAADIRSKLKDGFYLFNADGSYRGTFELASQRCNVRLVSGPDGAIYQLNSEMGLLRFNGTNEVVVPPGEVTLTGMTEPRYNSPATVYVGIQDKGPDSFGRALLDAAMDAEFVYVVPVVVDPDGGEPYTAVAKLRLLPAGNPPYEIVTLYDDPPLPDDNQHRNFLREIELDSAGNLYVLNVHSLNESDILWRYTPDGTVERVDLGYAEGASYVPAPIGMVASKHSDMLYLTPSVKDPADPDVTVIYGFSTNGPLMLERIITVNGAKHITGITEDPKTGTLWAAGFYMAHVPAYPNPTRAAFYYPCLVKVPADRDEAAIITLYDPDAHDLALPMSVLWTRAAK